MARRFLGDARLGRLRWVADHLTVVLAVGIERYGFGEELPGASVQAVRFARWALSCRVPPGRVLLACDGLGCARLPEGVQLVGTTREQNSKAVVGLAELQGELLMVFWCGHGVVDEEGRRVLFTSDAVQHNLAGAEMSSVQVRAHAADDQIPGAVLWLFSCERPRGGCLPRHDGWLCCCDRPT